MDGPDSLSSTTAVSVGGAVFLRMRSGIERNGTEGLTELVPELMHMVVLPYLGAEAAAEELADLGDAEAPLVRRRDR